jgi:diguanylate cyclase (GGDEF)-like protein
MLLPGVSEQAASSDRSAWLVQQPLISSRSGIQQGSVSILAKSSGGPAVPEWFFTATVLIVAVLIAAATSTWLIRRLVDPVEQLADTWRVADAADLPDRLEQRRDAIGRIARSLFSLRRQVQSWHEKATQLEQSVEKRVAAQTHHISVARKKAERQLWLDPLTGLTSRRFIDEKLPRVFDAQRDIGQDLSIVMLDLNDFKQFNDTYGHPVGDELLRLAGNLLRQGLRDTDIAARYGGDEFMVILPGVSAEQAERIARRTAALFAQQSRGIGSTRHRAGLSAGVASLGDSCPYNLAELVRLADGALYQAKRTGKSVCTAQPRSGKPSLAIRQPPTV